MGFLEDMKDKLKKKMEEMKGKIPGMGKKTEELSATASVEQAGGGKRRRRYHKRISWT